MIALHLIITAIFFLWLFLTIDKKINWHMEWPFPFSMLWSFSLGMFLFTLFLPLTSAIKAQIKGEGNLRISMLMPENFNFMDLTLIGMAGGLILYNAFEIIREMYKHGESVMWPYPWEEYGLMGLVLSMRYWAISTVMILGSGFGGYLLSKILFG